MSYSCVYEKTIFYSPTTKHSVISVRTKDGSIPAKARKAANGRDDFIRFVARGYDLPQTDKISMVLDGEWESGKYGTQLNVESCEEIVPHTAEGLKGYLSSCLVKGIGAKTADEIIKKFGADTLNIIENNPQRLLEIKGISEQKLEEIKRTFNEGISFMFNSADELLMRMEIEINYLTESIGINTDDEDDYEDKSYQLVLTVISEEKEKNDGSLSKEQFDEIEKILEDTSIGLCEAYFKILDYLNDICHFKN